MDMRSLAFAVALILPFAGASPVRAQNQTQSTGCVEVPKPSPTDTNKGAHSGSQNMGSTGWTGGQTDQKKTDESHPATAQGLDPTKREQQDRPKC